MVSKVRHVCGGFGGNDFRFSGAQIAVANDFVLDELNRTLQIRITGYSGGNVGDLVIVGVKSGKSRAVGEISGIERDGTIVVKESPDVTWNTEFFRDMGKGDQRVFVGFAPHVQRVLGIQMSLGLSGGDFFTTDPVPIIDTVIIAMDGDGDGIITVGEAEAFVQQAKALIRRQEGLSLGELALGIPPRLKVTGVNLSGTGTTVEEVTLFNGITAQVHVVDGKQVIYLPWNEQATHGIGVNGFGDVDLFIFDDFMNETRDRINVQPGTFPYGARRDEKPWTASSVYINLVDKERETMVVKDEKIKSIKKVKKCGKCYYKLEIEDIGLVPTVQAGKYEDCLSFIWRTA
jgi:hypothetical protein